MNLYENIIIGRQELTEQQMEALIVGLSMFVTQNGGETVRSEYCGCRELAYPIKKNNKGHYYIMQIKMKPEHLKEFEQKMSFNEDIIRFLIVKVKRFDTRDNLITVARSFRKDTTQIHDTGYRARKQNL